MNRIFLTVILTISAVCSRAETLLVSEPVGTSGYLISIVNAYQVDDEIWITSDTEQFGVAALAATLVTDSAVADLPSIIAKHVGDIPKEQHLNASLLYARRAQVADFRFDAGDGWVNSQAVGWIYIRSYPWIWHPQLGWLFVSEGEIVRQHMSTDLSFFFFSKTYGWLWKHPYSTEFFSFSLGSYVSIEDLTEANK